MYKQSTPPPPPPQAGSCYVRLELYTLKLQQTNSLDVEVDRIRPELIVPWDTGSFQVVIRGRSATYCYRPFW